MHTIHSLFGTNFWASLFVIGNILLMETLLSIDNAAVLAIMVGKLPEKQRPKALEYGIWGAFILRGVCLALVSFLVSVWWLKIFGGLYLMYLCYGHFTKANDTVEEPSDPDTSTVFKFFHKYLGVFWSTVALVEVMDLTFSLDNIFAVTAFTSYLGLICIGVFIGIITMRFVAGYFVKLMEKFPFLENVAFVVIGLLGVKLALTLPEHFYPSSAFTKLITSEHADLFTSLLTLAVFIIPIVTSKFFNWPNRKASVDSAELTNAAKAVIHTTN
jgi:YkoY family integral membrane protein